MNLPAGMDVGGWAASHVCVTAAAGGIPEFAGDHALTRFLRKRQLPSGAWHGYWWCDPEYATAVALECLAGSRDEANQRAVAAGVQYLKRNRSNRSAFSLACKLIGLHHGGAPMPDVLVDRLLTLQ